MEKLTSENYAITTDSEALPEETVNKYTKRLCKTQVKKTDAEVDDLVANISDSSSSEESTGELPLISFRDLLLKNLFKLFIHLYVHSRMHLKKYFEKR